MTVFYIGYNSSAVLDMSQIRKPTSRWDTVDHLPEKDIKVIEVIVVNEIGWSQMSCDLSWRWKLL